MEKNKATTGKLSEILKGKAEIDFCCPRCGERAKLYEMRSQGQRVQVFTDGGYVVDPSDSYEPDWPLYCCGECGYVISRHFRCAGEPVVKDPFDLLEWLFEEYAHMVKNSAYEGDEFPIPE